MEVDFMQFINLGRCLILGEELVCLGREFALIKFSA
ncbi:hypothetical protein MED222_06010 [Vibrio sp. MED222]|nr:hypothetical protein MED222_06010 [Vibrio sp. MED222]